MVAFVREQFERLLAQGVDAAVNPVVEHRLFAERGHTRLVHFEDPVGRAQGNREDSRGCVSLDAQGFDGGEVEVAEDIPVKGKNAAPCPELAVAQLNRAAATEGALFANEVHAEAPTTTGDEVLDSLEQVVPDDGNALDAGLFKTGELPVEDGSPGDFDQAFGPCVRQRPEAFAFAAGDDDGGEWRRDVWSCV